VDLKYIKSIIDLMKKNSISEFELERQDFKIRLRRNANGVAQMGGAEEGGYIALPGPAVASPAVPVEPIVVTSPSTDLEIKSPMVGTFYRAPSPEAGNYVEIGSEVTPETVVCIIEAMKVMNEIKAEVKGVVTQVIADSAKPVEFGQPLFKIRPTA
jgi:acetyl-CoA carboxylase biotin carboxyl carrier protein